MLDNDFDKNFNRAAVGFGCFAALWYLVIIGAMCLGGYLLWINFGPNS